jgi:hypothetical protein
LRWPADFDGAHHVVDPSAWRKPSHDGELSEAERFGLRDRDGLNGRPVGSAFKLSTIDQTER